VVQCRVRTDNEIGLCLQHGKDILKFIPKSEEGNSGGASDSKLSLGPDGI
jgi:hypothetical protein